MGNNNIDFVINGELYLMRGPTICDSTGDVEYYSDKIVDIEFDASKENPDFSKVPLLDMVKMCRDMALCANGKLSYSGTDKFWQLFTNDGINFVLTECEKKPLLAKEVKTYKSLKDLDKDFIKLSQFLSKATFIGRKFKRTKPIQTNTGFESKNYMFSYDGSYYIALYCTRDLFLVKYIDQDSKEYYELIDSRYTLDGNYEFFGPVHEEYRDKANVYAEILKQVAQYNKGKGR